MARITHNDRAMAGDMLTIVLATSNQAKVRELQALLAGVPVQLLSTSDVLGTKLHVPEDGETLEANAIEKARVACRATRMMVLADDSGLEVDALGGRPGVRSARFAHDRATDAENNAALLRALDEIDDRRARFRCVLALASPWHDEVRSVEGRCEGVIARTHRGSGGFGYDPLFLVEELGSRSMAELTDDEKNAVSHRGRAVNALRPLLAQWINDRLDEAERVAG